MLPTGLLATDLLEECLEGHVSGQDDIGDVQSREGLQVGAMVHQEDRGQHVCQLVHLHRHVSIRHIDMPRPAIAMVQMHRQSGYHHACHVYTLLDGQPDGLSASQKHGRHRPAEKLGDVPGHAGTRMHVGLATSDSTAEAVSTIGRRRCFQLTSLSSVGFTPERAAIGICPAAGHGGLSRQCCTCSEYRACTSWSCLADVSACKFLIDIDAPRPA